MPGPRDSVATPPGQGGPRSDCPRGVPSLLPKSQGPKLRIAWRTAGSGTFRSVHFSGDGPKGCEASDAASLGPASFGFRPRHVPNRFVGWGRSLPYAVPLKTGLHSSHGASS